MRRLIIEDEMGRREICYSKMSLKELQQRVKEYEEKYSMKYEQFIKTLDCGDSSFDELTQAMDWEKSLAELKLR
jgi:hypothetical protein